MARRRFRWPQFRLREASEPSRDKCAPPIPGSESIRLQSAARRAWKFSSAKGIDLDLHSEFLPGEAIVQLRPGFRSRDFRRFLSSRGLKTLAQAPSGAALVGSPGLTAKTESARDGAASAQARRSTLELIEVLNSHPQIEYAEPNYLYAAKRVPNDRFFRDQLESLRSSAACGLGHRPSAIRSWLWRSSTAG